MEPVQEYIKYKLGRVVCNGNYGKIYALKQYPSRVIKVVNYEHIKYCISSHDKIMKLLSYLKKKDSSVTAKIYDYGNFTMDGNRFFYYIMPKLKYFNKSDDVILDLEEFYSTKKIDKTLPKKTINFIKAAKKLKYKYKDCHGGNLMQDRRGSYKLIDVESFLWAT